MLIGWGLHRRGPEFGTRHHPSADKFSMATASRSVVCLAWHHAHRLRNAKNASNGTKNTIVVQIFEVFELSSAKEGRVSLLVDVFPSASWAIGQGANVSMESDVELRLFWKTHCRGNELRSPRSQLQRPKQWWYRRRQARGSDEESNYAKKATWASA